MMFRTGRAVGLPEGVGVEGWATGMADGILVGFRLNDAVGSFVGSGRIGITGASVVGD